MNKANLILDSGAFSAWRLNKAIDLEAYCNYIKENEDWIENYVALDVINPNDTESAAKASFDNLRYMRSRGLNPMPVFHAGEDISWLLRMLDMGCEYIGLSASSLVKHRDIDDWYAFAWSHLVTRDGLPTVKVHAFGEGRYASLQCFPWASADNSNLLWGQRAGNMILPTGQFVGARNDKHNPKYQPDIALLPEEENAIFLDILKQAKICPTAFAERKHDAMLIRSYITGLFYLKCQERLRDAHPIQHFPNGFLQKSVSKAALDVQFDYYLVASDNPTTFPIYAKLKHPFVLFSYFALHKIPPNALRAYIADPVATMQVYHQWRKNYNILEKYIHA